MRRALVCLLATATVHAQQTVPAPRVDPQAEKTAGPEVVLTRTDTSVDVTVAGELFTRLHVSGPGELCLWPVRAANGAHVTRDFPLTKDAGLLAGEAKDHPHHRSIWFAHGNVNGVDFWHAVPGNGRIAFDGFEKSRFPQSVAVSTRWLDTKDGGSREVCKGYRVYRFGADADGRRWIDLTVTITATAGDLVFGDTKEGTMAVRVHPALRLKGKVAAGSILNSAGVRDRKAWGKRAAWVDYSGPLTEGGEILGVALFDHPDNLRHPTWWHARDYGLLAANPFGRHDFEKAPKGAGKFVLPAGDPLTLRYRVLVHPKRLSREVLDDQWQAWTRL